jgi:ATP-dependent DNA ligase
MLDELFRKVEAQFNVRPSTRKPSAPRGVAMLAKTYCGELPAFYAVEPKVDGVRVIVTADLDNGVVSFASRRGNRLASLDHLAQEVLDLFGAFRGIWTLDCEAVAGKGFFNDVGEIRSEAWQKLKASDTVDAEVVDVVEGEGKCAGMAGRIVVRLGRRYVNVGTGMSNETRRDLLARRAQVIGQTAEVAFHCVTPDASLRHPSLVRIRGDK